MSEETAKPIISLYGYKVAIGPLSEALLPLLHHWQNDITSTTLSGDGGDMRSSTAIDADWGPRLRGEIDGWYGFVIYDLESLEPIGYANIRDVDTRHGLAEVGITIGAKNLRGQGFGTEAMMLLLDYAFTKLGVHNVWLDTTSFNTRAVKSYVKAGFKEIGRRREAFRVGANAYDLVLMDCISTDFKRPEGEWGMSEVARIAEHGPH